MKTHWRFAAVVEAAAGNMVGGKRLWVRFSIFGGLPTAIKTCTLTGSGPKSKLGWLKTFNSVGTFAV